MADIFLSYSQQDKGRVQPLADALEAEGWSVWWDQKLQPGETWEDAKTYVGWMDLRLPSETEWEYAARGRGDGLGEYLWGNAEADCGRAITKGCAEGTRPVCSTPSGNTIDGLCDMAGNVWEWVEDDYHVSYDAERSTASAWIDSPRGLARVFRGGSVGDDPKLARVAERHANLPPFRFPLVGFRVARSVPCSSRCACASRVGAFLRCPRPCPSISSNRGAPTRIAKRR